MTSCTGSVRGGFGGIWKKSVSWVGFLPLTKKGRLSGLAEARRICALRAPHAIGADGKARIERMCIFLPCVETFNSKVIKGFVPELSSSYVFFVFLDSYVLCIYVMNILCTFHTYSCMAMLHVCVCVCVCAWVLCIQNISRLQFNLDKNEEFTRILEVFQIYSVLFWVYNCRGWYHFCINRVY